MLLGAGSEGDGRVRRGLRTTCAWKGSDMECTCCRGTDQVPRRAVLEYKHCVRAGTSRVHTASELVQRVLAACGHTPGRGYVGGMGWSLGTVLQTLGAARAIFWL